MKFTGDRGLGEATGRLSVRCDEMLGWASGTPPGRATPDLPAPGVRVNWSARLCNHLGGARSEQIIER